MTPAELDDQERREIFIQDQRGAIMFAEQKGLERGMKEGMEKGMEKSLEEGLEEGLEKGLEEGLKKGRDEEKLRIARALLDMMDDALIAEKTGLSADRIQQLRSETVSPPAALPE